MITIRRLMEPQVMPVVVMWATARDFTETERCVAGGDHAASYEEFESRGDGESHQGPFGLISRLLRDLAQQCLQRAGLPCRSSARCT